MISSSLKDDFLRFELEHIVHPVMHGQFTSKEIRENLAGEIDADIRKGIDPELAKGFSDLCPVAGAVPEDYMIRHIQVTPGFDLLAGIRFRGLDLERPFVAILHRTRNFAHEADLRMVLQKLAAEFAVFAPKAILFYQSSEGQSLSLPNEHVDKRILMGAIRDIAAIPPLADISIHKATVLDFYDQYASEYAIVTERNADFLRTETAERESDMEDCVRNHLTYKIFIAGEFAGVFVATHQKFLGAHGYYVMENLLFDQFRGKGYGPSVQGVVARELATLGGKVLFGSIYPSNLPSYRAAIGSHRIDIGGNYMVPITG